MEKYVRETEINTICGIDEVKVPTVAMSVTPPNLTYLAAKYGDPQCPRKLVRLQWKAQD